MNLKAGILFVALAMMSVASVTRAAEWRKMADCTLIENDFNDGDSFHVRWKGKEYIFRLYYVDTPESDDSLKDRVSDQAKYWDADPKRMPDLASAATAFSLDRLKEGFTVYTKYDDARGRSKIKRYFGMIKVGDEYLSESLVRAGHARIYGKWSPVLPDGTTDQKFKVRLRAAERRAKRDGSGGWAKDGALVAYLKSQSVPESTSANGHVVLDRSTALYSLESPPRRLGMLVKGASLEIVGAQSPAMMRVVFDNKGTAIEGQCKRTDLATVLRQLKANSETP